MVKCFVSHARSHAYEDVLLWNLPESAVSLQTTCSVRKGVAEGKKYSISKVSFHANMK